MKQASWLWPQGKRIAVVFNVCLEAWSDGHAPGISPMGNPLPARPGIIDTMAISWAAYGVKRGIYRLLDVLAKHGAKSSVMTCAIIAERAPQVVRDIADAGHEILSHSYGMDVIPLLLSEEEERKNIARCTDLLQNASGRPVKGWLSPRGTAGTKSPRFLAEAGYVWHGGVFDDDLPYIQEFDGRKIVAIPLGTDVNDMPSMKYGAAPGQMIDSFNQNVEIARNGGDLSIIDVTCHAHIYGRPRGAHFYGKIVEAAAACKDVWIATRLEIANHVLAQGKA